jgi:hypothetical protein
MLYPCVQSIMLFRYTSILGFVLLGQTLLLLSQTTNQANSRRYSNELPQLQFYEKAKWKALTPLVSPISDVKRVLGQPKEATDIARYFDPYPGDDKAVTPLFIYALDADWEIFVYLGKDCGYRSNSAAFPENRLCTIELLPKKHLSFRDRSFPAVFVKRHVSAADAAWDEYRDSEGLAYYVYTTRTPYGGNVPGNLQRIVYGPSDEELKRFNMTRKKSPFDVE